MSEILLSIIIPVYNVEKYLEECLSSVFYHDLRNCEVICVNDGSTDRSRDILQKYKSKYQALVLIDRENGGLIKARNSGYAAASGKYIYYLDSDDFLFPVVIQKMLAFANKNDLYVALFNSINSNDKTYYTLKEKPSDFQTGKEFYDEFYKLNHFFPPSVQWLYLYKKSFLDEKQIFFPENNRQEDEPFTVKAFYLADKVGILNIPIIYHRVFREGSITSTAGLPHLEDAKVAWRRLYYFLKENECKIPAFYQKIHSLYNGTIERLSKLENKGFIDNTFFSKEDYEIIYNCISNPLDFKYYWYYKNSSMLFNWYLKGKYRLIMAVLNRVLSFYFHLFVK